jgi:hypothetical protein
MKGSRDSKCGRALTGDVTDLLRCVWILKYSLNVKDVDV